MFLYFSGPRHGSQVPVRGSYPNPHFSFNIQLRVGFPVTPPWPASDLGSAGRSWSVLSHRCYELSSDCSAPFVIGSLLILSERPEASDSGWTYGWGSELNFECVRTGMDEEVFGQSFRPPILVAQKLQFLMTHLYRFPDNQLQKRCDLIMGSGLGRGLD